jgi:hypothetical protein
MALAVLITLVVPLAKLWAQDEDKNFKVGEKIEYKEGISPREAWFEGTVMNISPDAKSMLIRWDPRPDYAPYTHDGVSIYQQSYSITDLRHKKVRAAEKPENKNDGAAAAVTPGNAIKNKPGVAKTADTQGGTGLMTKEELLRYMRAHAFVNGVAKNDPQICKDLIEQIKRRGVKEQFDWNTDDLKPISESCCWYQANDTNVYDAINYNLGTPITLKWLSGTWLMAIIGGTVDSTPKDGKFTRTGEIYAKLGFLTIDEKGTYTWQVYPGDAPEKHVKGTWRYATKDEMGLRGGAGIVLQKAADGADWIAFKYLNPYMKGDNIDVQDLQVRGGKRRIGSRK